jgi:hypothetical protein
VKLYFALRGKAASLSRLKQFTEADKDWDHAAALTDVFPTDERIGLALERADRLARDGDPTRAVQAAAKVAAEAAVPADSLYAAACVHALAAASVQSDAATRTKYGETAIYLVRQAIAKGYKDRERMKKDPDLASIRGREDFQKLLAELDKAAK